MTSARAKLITAPAVSALARAFSNACLYVVDSGDLPAMLGQVDRAVAGTATEFEGFAGGQRIVASMRVRRLCASRMAVPGREAEPVEDPKQRVLGGHETYGSGLVTSATRVSTGRAARVVPASQRQRLLEGPARDGESDSRSSAECSPGRIGRARVDALDRARSPTAVRRRRLSMADPERRNHGGEWRRSTRRRWPDPGSPGGR